ncbi:glutathione peroxidase [candidate division KSB1 bacterium]|nr:glutathione peroxidase [candidate division KSB1 bacterium]
MVSIFGKELKAQGENGGALGYTMKSIDGQDIALSQYTGQVLLIVNVASKCGFTPQYEDLQNIYEKYREKGFVILGVPANNFMRQEPGSNEEIKAFCSTNYGVTFPMFEKISVKGKDQHPLYQYLTDKKAHKFGGAIKWNFTKFLIGKDGHIIARFSPNTKPTDEKVIAAIEAALL